MADKKLRGAKLHGNLVVPRETHTPARFAAVWDSDGYFQPGVSDEVLTIPKVKRRGRYQIRVAVRWMNPWTEQGEPPPSYDDFCAMDYYSYLTINGNLLGNDARATAAPVLVAAGTTQYFAVDENLGLGDSVGLMLWQTAGNNVWATVFLEIRRLGRRVAALTTSAAGPPDASEDAG
jgi:hypothetical protein